MCIHTEILRELLDDVLTVDIVELEGGGFDVHLICLHDGLDMPEHILMQIRAEYFREDRDMRARGLRNVVFVPKADTVKNYDDPHDYNYSEHGLCTVMDLLNLEKQLIDNINAGGTIDLGVIAIPVTPDGAPGGQPVQVPDDAIPPYLRSLIDRVNAAAAQKNVEVGEAEMKDT